MIKALHKKALYMHFCRHNLNLVIVSAFKFPVIRNVLDKVQEVAQMFIKDSKKKMKLLEEVVKQSLLLLAKSSFQCILLDGLKT